MFAIIGIVLVIGAIIGGYLMEHGHLEVLVQPAELVIIGGAAIGTLLIANPLSVVTALIKGLIGVLKGSPYSKKFYLDSLKMLNEIFTYARKNGFRATMHNESSLADLKQLVDQGRRLGAPRQGVVHHPAGREIVGGCGVEGAGLTGV